MESLQACTEPLRKWISQHTKEIQDALQISPYISLETSDNYSNRRSDINSPPPGLIYWLQMKLKYNTLQSRSLQEVFQYVEQTPLLYMLNDFISTLDEFLVKYEDHSRTNSNNTVPINSDNGTVLAVQSSTTKETGGSRVDGLFLEALECYCLLKCRYIKIKTQWETVIRAMLPERSFKGFVECHRLLMITKLSDLVTLLYSIMHGCYGDVKPRYIQLCERLSLSNKEVEAMHYIFIRNSGVKLVKSLKCLNEAIVMGMGGSYSNSMAMEAALFADMTGSEMYEFFGEGRSHLKQELFGPEDEFSTILSSGFLLMPPAVIKACCGCTLTADEFYKLDKTELVDILNKEKKRDGVVKRKKPTEEEGEGEEKGVLNMIESVLGTINDGGGEEGEGEEGGKGEGGLEAILKAVSSMELGRVKKRTPFTDEEGGDEMEESEEGEEDEGDNSEPQPYKTDLEYLEDNFELIETLVKARKTETSDEIMLRSDQKRPEAAMRAMRAKARSLTAKVKRRMDATKQAGDWLPRLERLATLRGLDSFEINVLLTLTGCMVSRNLRDSRDHNSVFSHKTNIGMLIGLFCEGLGEQIKARVYFYRNSRLVKEGLIQLSDPPALSHGRNFLDHGVELDQRLLDYIVGLDTEINELVDGSDLYTPDILLSDVAIPSHQRDLLLNTFDSFHKFQKTCKELKLATHGYNKGLCLMFYGPPGTGKTMTANAVANHLGKKLLLVTVSLLTESQLNKDLLRFLFREAKIHNAVIFFDECEILFESRDMRPSTSLVLLLTEIEQYDGIIFLATNRHQDLDEAMHRRIQLALPFSLPDYTLRKDIWRTHVPCQLLSQEGVSDSDWSELAQSYELTGGLIRNAVLSAISMATKQSGDKLTLSIKDLHNGAKLQLKGLLEMIDFERRIIPTYGLDEFVIESSTSSQVEAIINSGKTHKFIKTQWGFNGQSGENVALTSGIVCLLTGPAGIGKSSLAYSIAYELGQPIKEATCTELLSHTVNSNPRAGRGIATFFRDALKANAIIVLDGAEFVLGSVSNSMLSGLVGCETYSLAYQIEQYPGMVILTSRLEVGLLDIARLPKIRYIVPLRTPSVSVRERIWKKLIPRKLPVSSHGLDLYQIAERFCFTGGDIATVICGAAELIANSTNKEPATQKEVVTTELLTQVAEELMTRKRMGQTHLSIFQ